MDYDIGFSENKNYFFTNYPGNKLMVGKISLKNAIARLPKNEYYVLVTYSKGESLPEEYVPYDRITSDDGTLFATVSPNIMINCIYRNDVIQLIRSSRGSENSVPRYLSGEELDEVQLYDLVDEVVEATIGSHRMSI